MSELDAIGKEIIRAGATYPGAVPSSYFQPLTNPSSGGGTVRRKGIGLTSKTNTLQSRPAYGATRDEGAVGPITALSPYADVVDYHRRQKKRACFEENCRKVPAKEFEFVGKVPTAETIISMTAAGKKPPVPGQGQIEKHEKSLSEISAYIATAVSRRVNDKMESIESIRRFNAPMNNVDLSREIYRDTGRPEPMLLRKRHYLPL